MRIDQFCNVVQKFHCLDYYELVDAGIMDPNDRHWVEFRTNPIRYFIEADAPTQVKLWALVKEKDDG